LLALCLAAAHTLNAQTPAFEVASIKTAVDPGRAPMIYLTPCTPGERLSVDDSLVDIRFMSLYRLILNAYRIKPYQLSGPDWMKNSQRFDIMAKIPNGASKEQLPEMLQALLVERFKMSIHRETKEQPVYALVAGKNGSKMEHSTADADAPLPDSPRGRGLYTPQVEARIEANGDLVVMGGPYGPMRGARLLKITMTGLAELLSGQHLDRPVINTTNLKGNYQVAWETPAPPPPGSVGLVPFDLGEAIIAAIEKAGLKLEKSKAPIETIIVDHLEKWRRCRPKIRLAISDKLRGKKAFTRV
jgi:uncharacterized protein (TIGR03435 family)